MKVRWR
jgi:hypothetical protein